MAITTGLEVSHNGHNHHHGHGHHHHHHHSHHTHNVPNHNQNGHQSSPMHHYATSSPLQSQYHLAQQQQFMAQNIMVDVWQNNFHEGMHLMRQLAKQCKVVAIDTEFPGVVAKVHGDYATTFEQAYHNIRANIDLLKPIQIGFSFFNEKGNHPQTVSTIQFNFKWDIEVEAYADNSIQLLQKSGIDFFKLKRDGVDLQDFAEAFTTSGLALNDNIIWVGFHSAYDWAYLLKICTNWACMPEQLSEYQKILLLFFPKIVDIKTMMGESKLLKGGLQELADQLKVLRVGAQHQAGSDSKLTGETYFRFLEEHCDGKLEERFVNYVYGLNYCPNGAQYLWAPLMGSSPTPVDGDSASGTLSSSCSSNNSGRNSPLEECSSFSSGESS